MITNTTSKAVLVHKTFFCVFISLVFKMRARKSLTSIMLLRQTSALSEVIINCLHQVQLFLKNSSFLQRIKRGVKDTNQQSETVKKKFFWGGNGMLS